MESKFKKIIELGSEILELYNLCQKEYKETRYALSYMSPIFLIVKEQLELLKKDKNYNVSTIPDGLLAEGEILGELRDNLRKALLEINHLFNENPELEIKFKEFVKRKKIGGLELK